MKINIVKILIAGCIFLSVSMMLLVSCSPSHYIGDGDDSYEMYYDEYYYDDDDYLMDDERW